MDGTELADAVSPPPKAVRVLLAVVGYNTPFWSTHNIFVAKLFVNG